MTMSMIWPFVLGALGIYTLVLGVRIIVTGKLTAREEERIKDFSEQGARSYRVLNAVMNIVAGFLIVGYAVVRYLEQQGIIPENIVSKLVLLGVVVVMVVIYFIVRNKCKNM